MPRPEPKAAGATQAPEGASVPPVKSARKTAELLGISPRQVERARTMHGGSICYPGGLAFVWQMGSKCYVPALQVRTARVQLPWASMLRKSEADVGRRSFK